MWTVHYRLPIGSLKGSLRTLHEAREIDKAAEETHKKVTTLMILSATDKDVPCKSNYNIVYVYVYIHIYYIYI